MKTTVIGYDLGHPEPQLKGGALNGQYETLQLAELSVIATKSRSQTSLT